MTTPNQTTQDQQAELVAQDTTQQLQRIFTGHLVAASGTGTVSLLATVQSVTELNGFPAVLVTIDGVSAVIQKNQKPFTFTCYFEPRFYWNGTANVEALPPAKAKCVVVFPKNDPQNVGFALTFLGWPTQ